MTVVYSPINTLRINSNGVLIESARTNTLLQSQALATAPWAATGVGAAAPTVTNNSADVLAPDNSVTTTKIEIPAVAAGETSVNLQTFTGTAAKWSGSVWLQTASGTATVYLNILIPAGTTYTLECAVTTTPTRFKLENITLTAATWTWEVGVDVVAGNTAQAAQIVYAWGAQVELGAFCSSNIMTTTAARARPADVVTVANPLRTEDTTWIIDATCYSEHWRQEPAWDGDAICEMLGATNDRVVLKSEYSADRFICLIYDSAGASKKYTAPLGTCPSGSGTYRVVFSYTAGVVAMYINGVSQALSPTGVGTGLITTMPTSINIGYAVAGRGWLNGYIKDFKVARHADIARL